jgi:hypothetical protein
MQRGTVSLSKLTLLLEGFHTRQTAASLGQPQHTTASIVQEALREALADDGISQGPQGQALSVGTVLEGRDLSYVDLSALRFSATLRRADIRHTVFDACDLRHCSMDACDGRKASFVGATLHNVTFLAADLRWCDFRHAKLSHCTFLRADMRNVEANGAVFHECDFTMADMTGLRSTPQTLFERPTGFGKSRRLGWRCTGLSEGVLQPLVLFEKGHDTDSVKSLPSARPWRLGDSR